MIDSLLNYWPLLILAGIVALLVIERLCRRKDRPPYESRRSLLTKAELRFYESLREAVDGQWAIAPMVRMADLIKVKSGTPKRQAWLNRILAKHIDFVLCDQQTLKPMLAVELDDRTHERPERIRRDQFVDSALTSAGLPILRVRAASEYDPVELRKSIRDRAA